MNWWVRKWEVLCSLVPLFLSAATPRHSIEHTICCVHVILCQQLLILARTVEYAPIIDSIGNVYAHSSTPGHSHQAQER